MGDFYEGVAILLSVQNLEKSFGAKTLFEPISFAIETGDRVGLIGSNGAGKSTLLKILAGRETPDDGDVIRTRGLKLGFLEQDPRFGPDDTIFSAVAENLDVENLGRVNEWLRRMALVDDGRHEETRVDSLSGGWKKRLALARELVHEPDLLILDEPTNHLDLESILFLEELFQTARFATLTVTHDRMFLERVANRILDLDRKNPGGLFSVNGTYADYLEAKDAMLSAQAKREEVARNTLRRETEWLRRGAKARTTKQTARIGRAEALGSEVEELSSRNLSRSAQIDFHSAERNPQKLIEAAGISQSFQDEKLFGPIDLLVTPRSRLGLLGANGSGKTTLIRILLGELKPTSGTVKTAEKLRVAYFAQHRAELNPQISVLKTLCPEGDTIQFKGHSIFARSYLGRFLFRTEQMDMPVEKLSGGEKARLRIAQLMLIPANVLVLDEPTNDLDMDTLRVLEESLRDFDGAVILVTHDRYFLDQVANQILAFVDDENGVKRIERFADTFQWENWIRDVRTKKITIAKSGSSAAGGENSKGKRKLTYKDQRELDGMEKTILAAEGKLEEIKSALADMSNISNSTKLTELTKSLSDQEALVAKLYARWSELSS